MTFINKPKTPPIPVKTLPGRATPTKIVLNHFVCGAPLKGPFLATSEVIYFGMGCFWGAERLFWELAGVGVTAAGYQGGETPNPTYEELCSGNTGHAEVAMVVFDPEIIDLADLLKKFWENHDPTQGMRQGNDVGSQYRSAIYTTSAGQLAAAKASATEYGRALRARGLGAISTEIGVAKPFYFAEEHHQQYLAKNPDGYCGLEGTGVLCPLPRR